MCRSTIDAVTVGSAASATNETGRPSTVATSSVRILTAPNVLLNGARLDARPLELKLEGYTEGPLASLYAMIAPYKCKPTIAPTTNTAVSVNSFVRSKTKTVATAKTKIDGNRSLRRENKRPCFRHSEYAIRN